MNTSHVVEHTLDRSSWMDGWDETEALDAHNVNWAGVQQMTRLGDAKTRAGQMLFWAVVTICLGTLVAIALVGVWTQSEANRWSFAYSQEMVRWDRLQHEQKRQLGDLAMLRDPARLSRIALQDLGLRPASREQLISEHQVLTQLSAPPQVIQIAQRTQILSMVAR